MLATDAVGGGSRQRRVGEAHLGGGRDSGKPLFSLFCHATLKWLTVNDNYSKFVCASALAEGVALQTGSTTPAEKPQFCVTRAIPTQESPHHGKRIFTPFRVGRFAQCMLTTAPLPTPDAPASLMRVRESLLRGPHFLVPLS